MTLAFTATVRLGTEKQVAAGILAGATVHVWVNNEQVVDLCDWKIRNFSTGIAALPPQRNAGQDKDGKNKYFNIFRLFPNDIPRYKDVQRIVLEEYYKQQQAAQQQHATAPAPAAAPRPAPTPVESFPSAGGPAAPPETRAPQSPPQPPAAPNFPSAPAAPAAPTPPQTPANAPSPPADWGYDS